MVSIGIDRTCASFKAILLPNPVLTNRESFSISLVILPFCHLLPKASENLVNDNVSQLKRIWSACIGHSESLCVKEHVFRHSSRWRPFNIG